MPDLHPPTGAALPPHASLVEQAFTRVTGSRARGGNGVRLLRDAAANYPAWLDAIRQARRTVHFENYIVAGDAVGRLFADALAERARAGVTVRFLYDWWGSLGQAPAAYWSGLRAAGVEVRAFNPPRLASPFAWVSRNHRKTLTVDGEVGFVSGLCVAQDWAGYPDKGIPPWRDTGVEVRGPAVADLDAAFAEVWALAGGGLVAPVAGGPAPVSDGAEVRVIRGRPGQLGAYRLDQLVAAGAQKRLWLTDAYFVATTPYVRALVEADRDGVDVRLLLPGSSDVPVAQMLARAGYRPLLEAGIRIWEWDGPMLHAKTAVCDGRWARVGSTNLNPTSWLSNWELDVTVEDPRFADAMEAAYLEDLGNATEVVLEGRRVRAGHAAPSAPRRYRARAGSGGRFAAGAISLGSAAGAALSGSRPLGGTEAGAVGPIGAAALVVALAIALVPALVAYPLAALLAWGGIGLLARASRLRAVAKPKE